MTMNNKKPPYIRPGSKQYTKRFIKPGSGSVMRQALAASIARVVAEDVNTALYVRAYEAGNFSQREDYIEYLANRIEWVMNQQGLS